MKCGAAMLGLLLMAGCAEDMANSSMTGPPIAPMHLTRNLPRTPTSVEWQLDFDGEALEAAIGLYRAYYLLQLPNASKNAPGRADALPAVSPYGQTTDWRLLVVCVDPTDGKIAWSRNVRSYCHLAVDPRNDNVHLYDRGCITLGATHGEIVKQLPPLSDFRLDGVIIGSTPIYMPRRRGDDAWQLVNPDTGRLLRFDASSLELLSADERYQLQVEREPHWRLRCINTADQTTQWVCQPEMANRVFQRIMPIWAGDRVYWLLGDPGHAGLIICLNADTGSKIWEQRVAPGVYWSELHQLRGGAYAPPFSPLLLAGQYVCVMDSTGTIQLFDAANGLPLGALPAAADHLCPPAIRGDQLIVSSLTGLHGFPLIRTSTNTLSIR